MEKSRDYTWFEYKIVCLYGKMTKGVKDLPRFVPAIARICDAIARK